MLTFNYLPSKMERMRNIIVLERVANKWEEWEPGDGIIPQKLQNEQGWRFVTPFGWKWNNVYPNWHAAHAGAGKLRRYAIHHIENMLKEQRQALAEGRYKTTGLSVESFYETESSLSPVTS